MSTTISVWITLRIGVVGCNAKGSDASLALIILLTNRLVITKMEYKNSRKLKMYTFYSVKQNKNTSFPSCILC